MKDDTHPAAVGGALTPADRLIRLRLIRSRRVGPQTFHRLIAEHGDAAAALDALPGVAAAAGVRDYAPCTKAEAEAEVDAGFRAGARLICHGEPGYPAPLTDLIDAPPVLWALGHPRAAARPMVALVGARNASSLGVRMARRLAEGLGAAGYAGRGRSHLSGRKRETGRRHRPRRAAPVGTSTRHGPAGAPFSAAQPVDLGTCAGGHRGRGGGEIGQSDHRARRARPGARGDGGARAPVRRPRLGAGWMFRQAQPVAGDGGGQFRVFFRIDAIDPARPRPPVPRRPAIWRRASWACWALPRWPRIS